MTNYVKLPEYYAKYVNLPILTETEQRELIRKLKDGNKYAGEKLIAHNMRLVVRSVGRFSGFTTNIDDLMQEGSLGILQAARKFDEGKKVRFVTYAVWWVDAYISIFYNKNRTQVKNAAPHHIHSELSLDDHSAANVTSRPHDDEMSMSLAEVVVNTSQEQGRTPEEEFMWAEMTDKFIRTKRYFKGLDKAILNERLISDNSMTLEQIGKKFGKSREWVRQREFSVRKRVKSIMSRHYSDYTV